MGRACVWFRAALWALSWDPAFRGRPWSLGAAQSLAAWAGPVARTPGWLRAQWKHRPPWPHSPQGLAETLLRTAGDDVTREGKQLPGPGRSLEAQAASQFLGEDAGAPALSCCLSDQLQLSNYMSSPQGANQSPKPNSVPQARSACGLRGTHPRASLQLQAHPARPTAGWLAPGTKPPSQSPGQPL